jgi:hypothetical protein
MGSGATSGLMVTRSIRGIPVSTMKVPVSKGADLGAGDDPDEIEVDPDAGFEV